VRLVAGSAAKLQSSMMADVGRYRRKVFVERLGWPLRCDNGCEFDQFDRPDTVYVVALGEDGRLVGTARLLPTTRPYLLGTVFGELLGGLPAPCSPRIWELSRFAAVDFKAGNASAPGQFSSPVAFQLLKTSMACARSHGARRLVSVSPLAAERLLRNAGIRSHRVAPPVLIDGQPLVACSICLQ